MGTYKLSAKELAEIINNALETAEGDFDLSELHEAWELVVEEQTKILSDE